MVRAILAGTKTQTRRIAKGERASRGMESGWLLKPYGFLNDRQFAKAACPYGQPGDRLWVRETWMPDPPRDGTWPHVTYDGCKPHDKSLIPDRFHSPEHCLYRGTWKGHDLTGWTPAIHMPRWASRILLEITEVRVERLQAISEADAIAEGIEPAYVDVMGRQRWRMYPHRDGRGGPEDEVVTYVGPTHTSKPRESYRSLWLGINGTGSWDANPWVWVVEFKRIP